jgi:hypothetical protein
MLNAPRLKASFTRLSAMDFLQVSLIDRAHVLSERPASGIDGPAPRRDAALSRNRTGVQPFVNRPRAEMEQNFGEMQRL